jgi:lysophospholipase L1-like esterase
VKSGLVIIVAIILGLVFIIEVGLRLFFGFGNPLIYIGDEEIGYILAPNQRTRRFGNRIEINQFSMRGAAIAKTPAPETLRVLLVGDSIANGGWWTDQENTISNLMMRSLTAIEMSNFTRIEVLNASANSWGPRNELAYLKRFSSFDAEVVILLINTDDLFATAPTALPVGRDRNYPAKKPPLALVEVWQRYVSKQKPIPQLQALQQEPGDRVGINLEAIGKIKALTNTHGSKFLLAMTPLLRETSPNKPRDYEIKARQRLLKFTEAEQITYIDFLPIFNSEQDIKRFYQDHIHFNLQGNKILSQTIEKSVLELLGQKNLQNLSRKPLD